MKRVHDRVLHLHDTLEARLKPVVPENGTSLGFYCCGPTVYGPAHIGNFRTFVVQDLFRRVVELSGFATRHVRNVTDVDDKTIRESQAQSMSLEAFTAHWKDRFHEDGRALNLLPPHEEPSAVAHIEEQIHWIKRLVDHDIAYRAEDGSVYFRVAAFADYGRLSGLKDRELKPSASKRSQLSDEYEKDALADFALWKAHKPEDGPYAWESPWGRGRPGWHIECTAMSVKCLGQAFDVHSGGIDLIFPHHENEIAQCEAVTHKPLARHWFHIAHLLVEGTKMSKSLGNLYTLKDLEEKGYKGAEVRYALLMGHYRQSLNFTFSSLKAARQGLQRMSKVANRLLQQVGRTGLASYEECLSRAGKEKAWGPFIGVWEALLKDLNAPKALGALFSALGPLERSDALSDEEAAIALQGLEFCVAVLGWPLPKAEEKKRDEDSEIPESINAMAEKRWQAKKERDWQAADALRDELKALGWIVRDQSDSYKLERVAVNG